MSTKAHGGHPLRKNIKVFTNDPKHETITLELTGHVKKFATISPSKVFLKGKVGEPIVQTVKIIPGEAEAFKIVKSKALKGVDFKFTLKEIENEGTPEWALVVENTRETGGRYFDKIFLTTDRPDQKPISVVVSGYIIDPNQPISEKRPPLTAPHPAMKKSGIVPPVSSEGKPALPSAPAAVGTVPDAPPLPEKNR